MTAALIPKVTYQVTDDVKIGPCQFGRGELVVFSSGGYSPYDDCFVYEFVDASGKKRICTSQNAWSESELRNFVPLDEQK